MSIYQELILDHYRNPRNHGSIKHPTKTAVLYNPLCGDRIKIDILLRDEKIKDIRFSGSGCAISQASASMLTEFTKGKAIKELRKIDQSFILEMLGIELSPNRLKCALLPLEALKQIVNG